MKNTVDVSIVIVTYNTKDILLSCLSSIVESTKSLARLEIIIIDNASTDDTKDAIGMFIGKHKSKISISLVINNHNVGFSAANNVGIRMTGGRYILLLNSDTVVEKDTIWDMVTLMDATPDAGVSTCRLALSDGTLDPACHRGFPTPWAAFTYLLGLERFFPKSHLFGQYHQLYKDMNTVHEIDSPSGAFFLVRRNIISKVGLLDEKFFMYGEDIDWAYRIKQAGWRILYNPRVAVVHLKKQSGLARHRDTVLRKDIEKHFYNAMSIFYKKHYWSQYPKIIGWIILVLLRLKSFLISI